MHASKTNQPSNSVSSLQPSRIFGKGNDTEQEQVKTHENQTSEDSTTNIEHSFGNIPLFAENRVFIQPKLTINEPNDKYEQEADLMAEQVMRIHQQSPPLNPSPNNPISTIQRECDTCEKENEEEKSGTLMRKAENGSGFLASPTLVTQLNTTKGGGFPLPTGTRSFMENAFNANLSGVRVHTGNRANDMNRGIQARAFTHGQDIYFKEGEYEPESSRGKKLLAHELTHTIQQSSTRNPITNTLQLKPDDAQSSTVKFPYSVTITSKLNSDDLLVEFVKQYHQVATDEEARQIINTRKWTWEGNPPVVTDEDVRKKYKLVTVRVKGAVPVIERSEKDQKVAFGALSKPTQQAVNEQADKNFWDNTKYKPNQTLGGSADDKKMSQTWMMFRDRLVQEKIMIDSMPASMKKIVLNPKEYGPENYEQLSRIINKLSTLNAEELEDYINKITANTDDLSVLEKSVDSYLTKISQRREEAIKRDEIKTKLWGTEDLYERYKVWKNLERYASTPTGSMGGASGYASAEKKNKADQMKEALIKDLVDAGFKGGISDFEKMIRDFKSVFELESLRIGNDLLDQFLHILYEAEIKYSNDAEVAALHQSVSSSNAKADYEEADKIRSEHGQLAYTLDELSEMSYWVGKREEAIQRGDSKITSLSKDNPIIRAKKFDIEGLARTSSKEDVKKYLFDYIGARREDIASAKKTLTKHPKIVYKADSLRQKSYEKMTIQSKSIYDKIIQDEINDISISETIVKVFVGILAIALGIVSMGTGTAAVLAGAGAFGLSAYQAVEEYRDYEEKQGLSGAGLISSDPSKFWVVAAIVGAGLDLAVVASTIKTISPALKVLEETNDIAKFEKSLSELEKIDVKLRVNLVEAAKSEVQYSKAVSDFKPFLGRAYVVAGIPDIEAAWNLGKVAYAALKRGINTFEKFLLELKAQKIINNIDTLTKEEKALFKQAWLDALSEDTRLSKIQTIGDKIPINAQDFAGKLYSFDLTKNPVAKARLAEKYSGTDLADKLKQFEDLAKKYPDGVKFTSKGFPDFSPYTVTLPNGKIGKFPFKTTGNRPKDFIEADKFANITEEYRQTNELVWHHMEDMQTMILIPRDVHGPVKHSGGISVFTNIVIEE